MDAALEEAVARGYAARDRDDMASTIEYFTTLQAAHPDEPQLVYEVAGAYDTAGDEATALGLYERAFAMGLDGDVLRRGLIQYGSTLRNLGELDASLRAFDRAEREFPGSAGVAVFRALSLLESGRADAAVGALLGVIAEHVEADLVRYRGAIAGNARYLAERDGRL